MYISSGPTKGHQAAKGIAGHQSPFYSKSTISLLAGSCLIATGRAQDIQFTLPWALG